MEQLVIGVFDRYADAEQVRQELLGVGLAQNDIRISAASEATRVGATADATEGSMAARSSASSSTATARGGEDESFGEKVADFFRSIFGGPSSSTETSRYAEAYPEAIRRGSAVVTVTVRDDSQLSLAQAVMERNGAIDIDERSASWSDRDTGAAAASSETTTSTGVRTSVPVVEEEIAVGKREVTRGRVRIVSVVSETPVEETLRLREEHATIERRPADRPASEAELESGWREGTVEIPETAEEPVVSKTARVVEEVVVGKEATERTETVSDTVRRKDVKVEREPAQTPPKGSTPGSTKR